MSEDSQARLFAALELPAAVRWRIAGWGQEVAAILGAPGAPASLRVLDRDSLHLTLSFLGARPAEQIGELAEALIDACEGFGALELGLGAPVWLPPRNPRALAIEVREESGALAALQRAVRRALCAEDGGRRFRPHVTAARTPSRFRVPNGLLVPVTPSLSFVGERVSLVRSWLEPSGARYELQDSAVLDGV